MADILGTANDDILLGGIDSDIIRGLAGNDTIEGGAGNDNIQGGEGADIIRGGDGFNTLYAGTTSSFSFDFSGYVDSDRGDVVTGGNDSDNIWASIGDLVDGGAGFDRLNLDLRLLANGLSANSNLYNSFRNGTFANIESLSIRMPDAGGVFTAAKLSPSLLLERISGGVGNDHIDLRRPFEQSFFIAVDAGNGDNVVYGSARSQNFLTSGSGNDTLYGGAGNDTLSSNGGNDKLYGGAGNDVLTLEGGGDFLDGGAGRDRLNFSGTINATCDLETNKLTLSGGQISVIDNFEDAFGTFGNDVFFANKRGSEIDGFFGDDNITGRGGDDLFRGGGGNDVIGGESGNDALSGGDGNDTVSGGDGNDYLTGGAGDDGLSGNNDNDDLDGGDGTDNLDGGLGNDSLFGGAGDDSLFGNDGDDLIYGDDGNDVLRGGDGNDTASYAFAAGGVKVFLASVAQQNTVGAGIDQLVNIENLTGSDFNDTLGGSGTANRIDGSDGNDSISGFGGDDDIVGGDGDDVIIGGTGLDRLSGGAGADIFRTALIDSTFAATGRDAIIDFSRADADRIGLVAIDANSELAGDQAFRTVSAFTNSAGQLVCSFDAARACVVVTGDVNGDGVADFAIDVFAVTSLSSVDFLL